MVIVNLKGGVGNQMFQYAVGRYLSILSNKELFLNTTVYDHGMSNRNFDLDIFNLSDYIIGDNERALDLMNLDRPFIHVNERFFHYDREQIYSIEDYFLSKKCEEENFDIILTGYWQSYKYFEKIEHNLKEDFIFKNPLYGKWKILNEEILSTNSVMINIRRGDYLRKLDYHGVVSIEYIKFAMKLMKQRLLNPIFYIFSDDIEWCKANIGNDGYICIVGEEYYDSKYQFYLQLMKNCKNFIISNSSFAWWSAWLSPSKNKIVIAPKNWFVEKSLNTKDLIPNNWVKI